MKKIIGLVGETGSGKDAASEYLKKNYKEVIVLRFSDPLREALSIFLDEQKKEDQQWLAILLRERFGGGIIWRALKKKIKNIKYGTVVLNGIRFMDEFAEIKRMGGKIIYVTAPAKLRWRRIHSRNERKDDKVSYRKFLQIKKAKTELLIPAIGRKADFIINNGGLKRDFHRDIKKAINKISPLLK